MAARPFELFEFSKSTARRGKNKSKRADLFTVIVETISAFLRGRSFRAILNNFTLVVTQKPNRNDSRRGAAPYKTLLVCFPGQNYRVQAGFSVG